MFLVGAAVIVAGSLVVNWEAISILKSFAPDQEEFGLCSGRLSSNAASDHVLKHPAKDCNFMEFNPYLGDTKPSGRFTNLSARISEEEDGYVVQVRLYSRTIPQNTAWGEETADSLEMASEMVGAIAAEFSILQACIKIEIRTQDPRQGTRH